MRPFRLLLPLLLVCSIASAADNAADLARNYRSLSTGSAVTLSNVALTSGRMRVNFASATAAPVKAGDRVIGTFYKGAGTLEYTADDPIEHPVLRTNLKNARAAAEVATSGANLVVKGKVSEVLWLDGAAAPSGANAASIESDFAANRTVFNNIQNGFREAFLITQLLNAPAAKSVYAELRGDDEWTYVYDPAIEQHESLIRLFTYNFDDRARRQERYPATISDISLGRTRRDRVPYPAIMTALDYDVTQVDEKNVTIVANETIVPTTANQRAFWLHIDQLTYANREVKPRELHVKSATLADGTALSVAENASDIIVSLPRAAAAGQPQQIKFTLQGDILYGPNGSSYWLLRDDWYPQFALGAQRHTVHGITRAKVPYVPISGGVEVSRKTEGGMNVIETSIDRPVNFFAVAAGKFKIDQETRDGLTLRTALYVHGNNAGMKKLKDLVFATVKYYEYFLGPFPMKELSVVQVDDYGWGQAPAGMVFITNEAFSPLATYTDQLFSEGINERVAHEIAHQYWSSGFTWGFEDQWLTESFAEYSAALFLKKFQGDAVYKRLVAHWRGDAKVSASFAPIPLASRIENPNDYTERNYVYLLYGKGPWLLAKLHEQVGDEAFLTFMKSYMKTFNG
ncbi:MAG TPA: M1 family aminopeptidase, partial [Thermoanaerobaculia bacterium]|nr:M1 family aminopeptidase [Thermoanaerobaculia bacterium]